MSFFKKISFVSAALFLLACTDYVADIDKQIEELEATIKNSSSSDSDKSSSSAKTPTLITSSSSTVKSSSSFNQFNPDIKYGELTDFRNRQTYKIVKIGSQTWMAENLNFETDSSFCYNNDESNCSKYGRLYKWAAAVGKSESECGYGNTCSLPSGNIQGVCPNGWHLPSRAEWETLFDSVGGLSTAGLLLKSISGWSNSGNGTDAFGFSALPAGNRYYVDTGHYYDNDEGRTAFFWSSTEHHSLDAYGMYLYSHSDLATPYVDAKCFGGSVRCLKDDALEQTANHFNPDIEYGELIDSRDGQTYKTVKIGPQTWMAQNLSYETSDSYCPDESANNCSAYGRFYKWNTAKTVCPAGWHLPSKAEFKALLAEVGGSITAGKELKTLTGWHSSGNGYDSYGFSAIPAGYKSADGEFAGVGYRAHFWSSTEDYGNHAYYMYVVYNETAAYVSGNYYGGNRLSVRCLKDDETIVSSSSSTVASSSSSVTPKSSDSETSVSTGSMTDSRDGQTYKTVVIGSQTWMAENLNYETDSSFCFNNEESNCTKYGRLYRWAAAVGKSESECGHGNTCSLPSGSIQGVCPSGWHLPSKAEWETLFNAVGDSSTAGKMLKSSSGWNSSGNGTDAFGFSARPAGNYDQGYFNNREDEASFWMADEFNSESASYARLRYWEAYVYLGDHYKHYGLSVRCLKD